MWMCGCIRVCVRVCVLESKRGEGVHMWTVHSGADMKTGQCMKSPSMGACASIVPWTPSVIFIFRRPVRSQSGFDIRKGCGSREGRGGELGVEGGYGIDGGGDQNKKKKKKKPDRQRDRVHEV